MTPGDLTPVQVQLLIDLADIDVVEHRENAAAILFRCNYVDSDPDAQRKAYAAGVRHAELRQQWIDIRDAR